MATVKLASMIFRRMPVITHHELFCKQKVLTTITSASYATRLVSKTPEIQEMKDILKTKFPLAKSIDIYDISGGCGGMYEINIESVEFKGLTVVKQHRLVNDALKDQIKEMHGVRIQTSVPPASMK